MEVIKKILPSASTVDWLVEAVVVIHGFNLWCIEEIKFSDEGSSDMDYQWFFYLWNGFWLEYTWKTSMSILYGQ
jgi:hypothetical protein